MTPYIVFIFVATFILYWQWSKATPGMQKEISHVITLVSSVLLTIGIGASMMIVAGKLLRS